MVQSYFCFIIQAIKLRLPPLPLLRRDQAVQPARETGLINDKINTTTNTVGFNYMYMGYTTHL